MKNKLLLIVVLVLLFAVSLIGLGLSVYSVFANSYKNFNDFFDGELYLFQADEMSIEVNYPTPEVKAVITREEDIKTVINAMTLARYKQKNYEIYLTVSSFTITHGEKRYTFTPYGYTIKFAGKEYKTNCRLGDIVFDLAEKYIGEGD